MVSQWGGENPTGWRRGGEKKTLDPPQPWGEKRILKNHNSGGGGRGNQFTATKKVCRRATGRKKTGEKKGGHGLKRANGSKRKRTSSKEAQQGEGEKKTPFGSKRGR